MPGSADIQGVFIYFLLIDVLDIIGTSDNYYSFLLSECLIPLGTGSVDKYLFPMVAVQIDIPIKYLNFFLEDDAELEHIKMVRFLFLVDFIKLLMKIFAVFFKI